jgi:Rod binding domain-containing protein
MDNAIQSMGSLALSQGMTSGIASRLNATANSNVDKTAKDFTSVFFSQMLQPMFDGVGVDPEFGGGHGEEVMKSFLTQEYGKIVANGGSGGGLTDAVKREIIRAQGQAAQIKARGGNHDSIQ